MTRSKGSKDCDNAIVGLVKSLDDFGTEWNCVGDDDGTYTTCRGGRAIEKFNSDKIIDVVDYAINGKACELMFEEDTEYSCYTIDYGCKTEYDGETADMEDEDEEDGELTDSHEGK